MEDSELSAMSEIQKLLEPLGEDARSRVLSWTISRFGVTKQGNAVELRTSAQSGSRTETDEGRGVEYEDFADFFDAASPKDQSQRVLVGGYWVQYLLGENHFSSQAVNSALKDLGHGVGNVTMCFNTLMSAKPSLAMQVRKSGASKQGRKQYKLTQAGRKVVEKMLGGNYEEIDL